MKRYWYTYAFVGDESRGIGTFRAPYAKVSPGLIRKLTENIEKRFDASGVTIVRITPL